MRPAAAVMPIAFAALAIAVADVACRDQRAGTNALIRSAPRVRELFVWWKAASAAVIAIAFLAVVPWVVALVSLPLYIVLGLTGAHAPASFYRALLLAPVFLARKLRIYARLLGGHDGAWVRTERPAESRDGDAMVSKA